MRSFFAFWIGGGGSVPAAVPVQSHNIFRGVTGAQAGELYRGVTSGGGSDLFRGPIATIAPSLFRRS